MQAAEHRRVVRNPVKDGVAENPIHLVRQFKILQAGLDKLNPFAKSREPLPRLRQHLRRKIQRNHCARRQPAQQFFGQPPAAAPCVQHPLVASQFQSLQHGHSPLELRIGEIVVGHRIPVCLAQFSLLNELGIPAIARNYWVAESVCPAVA